MVGVGTEGEEEDVPVDLQLLLVQAGTTLLLVWMFGRVFRLLGSQLVGEIIVGVIFGPLLLDWVPYPDALTLIGQLGLSLLVLEGGLSIDVPLFRRIGGRALVIAMTGTALPILLGWGMMSAFGFSGLEGVAAGTALSSTSIGMATKMLQNLGALRTNVGSLIAVAAMIDDVLSLVILAVLSSLAQNNNATTNTDNNNVSSSNNNNSSNSNNERSSSSIVATLFTGGSNSSVVTTTIGNNISGVNSSVISTVMVDATTNSTNITTTTTTTTITTTTITSTTSAALYAATESSSAAVDVNGWTIARPIVVSIVAIAIGAVLVWGMPAIERRITWPSIAMRQQGLILAMLCAALGLGAAAGWAGTTYLLGIFIGGMAFAQVPGALEAWETQQVLSSWLSSVFFLSVGFVVPVAQMFEATALGYGVAYTIPAVLGKLVTGSFAGSWADARIVGWAMVGRGELGFVMAQEALKEGIMGQEAFVASVWALLLATFLSPLMLKRALAQKVRRRQTTGRDEGDGDKPRAVVSEV